jgi:NAD(P)-dependent dehydrogenase (short-subunit alcohol dehydrogenase family)
VSGAIIIGAGPGIGTSVARRVAREGLTVGLIARSQQTLDGALSALDGADAFGVPADVTDEIGLRAALDVLMDRYGLPELLVYNVARIQWDAVGELSAEDHLEAWAVNVVGAITAVSHVAPLMAMAGAGTIVLTGGMPEPVPEVTSLSLGKAGVRALTKLLSTAYRSSGVHVATVTVAGAVAAGTGFDPDAIAEHYWRLHSQPVGTWEQEVVHTGREAPAQAADASAFVWGARKPVTSTSTP